MSARDNSTVTVKPKRKYTVRKSKKLKEDITDVISLEKTIEPPNFSKSFINSVLKENIYTVLYGRASGEQKLQTFKKALDIYANGLFGGEPLHNDYYILVVNPYVNSSAFCAKYLPGDKYKEASIHFNWHNSLLHSYAILDIKDGCIVGAYAGIPSLNLVNASIKKAARSFKTLTTKTNAYYKNHFFDSSAHYPNAGTRVNYNYDKLRTINEVHPNHYTNHIIGLIEYIVTGGVVLHNLKRSGDRYYTINYTDQSANTSTLLTTLLLSDNTLDLNIHSTINNNFFESSCLDPVKLITACSSSPPLSDTNLKRVEISNSFINFQTVREYETLYAYNDIVLNGVEQKCLYKILFNLNLYTNTRFPNTIFAHLLEEMEKSTLLDSLGLLQTAYIRYYSYELIRRCLA